MPLIVFCYERHSSGEDLWKPVPKMLTILEIAGWNRQARNVLGRRKWWPFGRHRDEGKTDALRQGPE